MGGTEIAANAAGTYTLSEAGVAGYVEGTWSCVDQNNVAVPVTNGGLFSGADVTVAQDKIVTCSITNDDEVPAPQLTVIKHVVNNNGGTAVASQWTMDVTAANPSNNNFPGAEAPGVTITIDAGAYSVDESGGPGGYTKSLSAGCSGNLDPGEMATCTITNEDVAPELTVIKHVVNDDGGTAVASDWTMDVTATNPSNNNFPGAEAPGVTITIDAGAYSVDESGGPGGYTKSLSAGCSGNLGPGEAATCTITNDDFFEIPPKLTLLKDVINDDGGEFIDTDWILIAEGPVVRSGVEGSDAVTSSEVLPGVYTLSESGPDGYGAGDWSCNGGSLNFDQLTLVEGDVATCTIINDDLATPVVPPDISVTKTVIPDIGDCPVVIGEHLDFTITVTNEGSGTADGVILEEQWSWQLKPSKSPDMYECSTPKPRLRRCKLGDMDPGGSKDIAIGFSGIIIFPYLR